jgi:hypothetical protein
LRGDRALRDSGLTAVVLVEVVDDILFEVADGAKSELEPSPLGAAARLVGRRALSVGRCAVNGVVLDEGALPRVGGDQPDRHHALTIV